MISIKKCKKNKIKYSHLIDLCRKKILEKIYKFKYDNTLNMYRKNLNKKLKKSKKLLIHYQKIFVIKFFNRHINQ